MAATETQHTTTDGDTISGEMVIRFQNIPLDDFLKYRKKVREITGFGQIGIDHFTVNEIALVTESNLERQPLKFRDAQPAPIPQEQSGPMAVPTQRLPGQPLKRGRNPSPPMRALFKKMVGWQQSEIIKAFRQEFHSWYNQQTTDAEIIGMYNKVHGL
jgi:hypothetical protein